MAAMKRRLQSQTFRSATLKIVDIYCNECDFDYDTAEIIPGKPPSCPYCGNCNTRYSKGDQDVCSSSDIPPTRGS